MQSQKKVNGFFNLDFLIKHYKDVPRMNLHIGFIQFDKFYKLEL